MKRRDKRRSSQGEPPPIITVPTDGSSSDQAVYPPQYSPSPAYPASSGITIPQHIVIPSVEGGKSGQPQRFHINSEITISYSDKSTNPSDSEGVVRRGKGPKIQPLPSQSGPRVTSPLEEVEGQAELKGNRASYGSRSTDSRGDGIRTAV